MQIPSQNFKSPSECISITLTVYTKICDGTNSENVFVKIIIVDLYMSIYTYKSVGSIYLPEHILGNHTVSFTLLHILLHLLSFMSIVYHERLLSF